jgi:hypothetical protein
MGDGGASAHPAAATSKIRIMSFCVLDMMIPQEIEGDYIILP